MRLIESEDLCPGMIVGMPMYAPNGTILLKEGSTLRENAIEKLIELQAPHIYIIDEYSQDIEASCNVSPAVKSKARLNIKNLYTAIQNNAGEYSNEMKACLASVDDIVDDITTENIDLFDLFDIKLRDQYIYSHPINVTAISVILGRQLQLNSLELYHLAVGAFLHDVGQMFIPKEILHKKSTYSNEDVEAMRKHAEAGYRFAKDEFYLPMRSYLAILQHHERYDGNGYPHQKKGKDISSYGRIVAIADVYDAISSHKPYRSALSPAQAFKTIIESAGSSFDPEYIKIFAQRVSPYPIGFTLKLPDKRTGIVYKNYLGKPFNPTMKIIEEDGQKLTVPYMMDL